MSAIPNPKRIQQVIDETVVLLVEVRAKKTVTTKHQKAIDELVEQLQECSRELPRMATDRKGLSKKVVSLIEQAIKVWHDVFGS